MDFDTMFAALFVILTVVLAIIYTRRSAAAALQIAGVGKVVDESVSELTESEPELEVQEKEVHKMDKIAEEDDSKDVESGQNDYSKNKKKKKKKKVKGDEDDGDQLSDSEEYSMQKMVEDYQKSRTFTKKVSEVIEDISDVFKRKTLEIKMKFVAPPPPAIVVPMAMKVDDKVKTVKKTKSRKKQPDFDDEKQVETPKKKVNPVSKDIQEFQVVEIACDDIV